MAPQISAILKVTGHGEEGDDLRYMSGLKSRDLWGFSPLTRDGIRGLVGKKRRIFVADPGGKFERLPAERLPTRKRTGIISAAYAARLEEMQSQGKIIAQRIVLGPMERRDDHGYQLAQERGTVIPLTLEALLRAKELGWSESLSVEAGRSILSRLMREGIRGLRLHRHAVKTITTTKKAGKTIASHNLVLAPHPRLLERIRRAGQSVDAVMEVAARRALEKMERQLGAKITALAATHLQDSTSIRPHLHLRLIAYDSNGKYLRLFDRQTGSGRCMLQPEVERQIVRIIERWEPRSRRD